MIRVFPPFWYQSLAALSARSGTRVHSQVAMPGARAKARDPRAPARSSYAAALASQWGPSPMMGRGTFVTLELQAYERERQTLTEMHGAVARATSLYGGTSDRELIEKERRYLMTAPFPTMTFQLEKYKGLPAFHLVAGLIEQMKQEADSDDSDDSDDDTLAHAKKAPAKKTKTGLGGVPAKKSQTVLEGVQNGTKRESQKNALANLRHDEKMLQKAEGLDRKRSLAVSKSGEGPTLAEVDGRWLRVDGYSEALAKRSPWIVPPQAKGGKAKGAKPAAALSRNFSVTRIAKDDSANVWVQGDVVPQMKKEELVGAAVSVDNMAICQAVQPMAIRTPIALGLS